MSMVDTNKKVTWDVLKFLTTDKQKPIQYTNQVNYYYVYIVENANIYYTNINITTPANADQIDFETNYLPTANAKLYDRVEFQEEILEELQINNNLYSRILPVLANGNFLKQANFDSIGESYLGNVATLSYKEDGFEIAKVIITFTSPTVWDIVIERYILDDDGDQLLDDDDTNLFLE